MYFRAGRSNGVKVAHFASLAVLAAYSVSISYRAGLLRKCLNASLYNKVEKVVEKVKEKTQPMGSPARLVLLRKHLMASYGYTLSGMGCVTAGVALFMYQPHIPIVIPLIAACVPGVIVAAVPRRVVSQSVRQALFHVCWLCAGYTLGPVGWIAQDVLATYVLVTASSVIGVTIPLYLTRGVVSYILSAQLLSLSLSTYVVTSTTSTASLFGMFKSHPGVQQILQSDICTMLFMQIASNFAILSFNTLPRIKKFVSWKGGDEELLEQSDPLWDATTICAGWVYIGYRTVREAFHRVLKRLSGRDSEVAPFASDSKNLNIISSVSSGLIIGVVYIQVISRLQQGDKMDETMSRMRQFFRRIAPKLVPARHG